MSWKVAQDVRYRRIFDEAVIIRQEASEVLGLNLAGTRILELVDEGRSTAEIVEVLSREFEVDRQALEADVGAFLARLAESGVIRPLAAGEE